MNGCATCSQLDMRRNSDQAKLLVGRLLLFASPSRFWNRGSCSSEDQLPSNDDRARPRRILPTLPTAYSHAADRALHGGGDDARRVLTSDLRPSPCRDTRRRSYLILAEPRARRLTRRLVAEGPHSPQLWLASRLAGLVGLHSRCIPREVPLWQ